MKVKNLNDTLINNNLINISMRIFIFMSIFNITKYTHTYIHTLTDTYIKFSLNTGQ